MKLSLLIWFNTFENVIPWIKKAKNIGYTAIELFIQKLSPQEVSIAKKLLTEHNLDCISCVILPEDADITSHNKKVREYGISFLKRCIEITAELNGELMTGVVYAPWGKVVSEFPKDDWHRSAASLKHVCEYASRSGIKMAIEPINHYRTYLINTCEDAIKFLESVGKENLGIHLDTYHMNIEERDFYSPVIAAGKRLYHVHCSESNRGILGTGHINWDEFFQALSEVDYQGHLGFEFYTPSVIGMNWKRVTPSIDEVVVKSLQFMREMYNKYMKR
jgi:D-psicose/D-tagatose/L-ribulose 3-epimerase